MSNDANEQSPIIVLKPVHQDSPGEGYEAGWETHGSVLATSRGWYGKTPELALGRALNDFLESRARSERRASDETDVAGALFAEWCKRVGLDLDEGPRTVYQLEEEFPVDVKQRTRVAEEAEIGRLLVDALDRCPHGRHQGDVCSGCGGASTGWTGDDAVLGHTIAGKPVRLPPRNARWSSAEAWLDAVRPDA